MTAVSPAEVLAAYLIANGFGTRPASSGAWPITTSSMPDDEPDNRITIYNTGTEIQGKLHKTGETLTSPECQIRVRSKPASSGYAKITAILNALSPLQGEDVTTNANEDVTIVSVTLIGGPAHIGQEEKNQRQHHTANVKLVIVPGG